MRILSVLFLSIFLCTYSSASTPATGSDDPVMPDKTVPFDAWPADMLLMRENELRVKVEADEKTINRAQSAEINFLLEQVKVYNRTSAFLSYLSKFVGIAGPGVTAFVTPFGVPAYAYYIIAGITASAPVMYHFAETNKESASALEKEAIKRHGDDIVEYQKIKMARKKREAAEAAEQGLTNSKVVQMLKTIYHGVTGTPEPPAGEEDLDDMERGFRLAFSPTRAAPVNRVFRAAVVESKGKEEAAVGYQSGLVGVTSEQALRVLASRDGGGVTDHDVPLVKGEEVVGLQPMLVPQPQAQSPKAMRRTKKKVHKDTVPKKTPGVEVVPAKAPEGSGAVVNLTPPSEIKPINSSANVTLEESKK